VIVHEDADLLVVDKPAGLLSANLPGEKREAIFDMVKEHVKSGKGKRRVWIIHRLDKEASGLMVFAKTEKAFHWLKEDFKAKRIKRLYIAVLEGEFGPDEKGDLPSGTIQSFIAENEFGDVKSIGVGETSKHTGAEARREKWSKKAPARPGETPDKPQLAVTHYRVLAVGRGHSMVQCRLETGRKNQIRLHMQELGKPIVGDWRFGAKTDPIQRVALHAADLGFTHPSSGQPVKFTSPAPAAFYRGVGAEPPRAPEFAKPSRNEPAPDNFPESADEKKAPARSGGLVKTSWDHVAAWYDQLIEEGKSDHFAQVILPGTLRLLKPLAGMRVLDVACGQGLLCRKLAEMGIDATGIDASPRLIETAKKRSEGLPIRFERGDARKIGEMPEAAGKGDFEPFDAVTSVMALMNIDPLEPVLTGCAKVLKPGGALVAIILHPAFRSPGQTSWGWDDKASKQKDAEPRIKQYRRVDGYLSTGQTPITMNPGYAAHGADKVETWTFHRPLQTYVRIFTEAGFVVEALEEWPSRRTSQPGPRAAEENRARREIPMFLGIRVIKR
jgi:23S rRNA-/tRNA-specific pseudouridylate synthase/SAM-dependent methyltransferase